MPKKLKKESSHKLRPDAAEIAFRTMLEATGQASKTKPGEGPKNPEAVRRGKKGAQAGGKARAAKLTAEERSISARAAARQRWLRDEKE